MERATRDVKAYLAEWPGFLAFPFSGSGEIVR